MLLNLLSFTLKRIAAVISVLTWLTSINRCFYWRLLAEWLYNSNMLWAYECFLSVAAVMAVGFLPTDSHWRLYNCTNDSNTPVKFKWDLFFIAKRAYGVSCLPVPQQQAESVTELRWAPKGLGLAPLPCAAQDHQRSPIQQQDRTMFWWMNNNKVNLGVISII